MNMSARAGRRIIAAVSLACSAVLLPAVALASSAASAPQAPAAVSQCRSSATEVWLGLNPDGGAAGTAFYPLEFTNISKHACWLFGYPGVSAIGRHGHRVGPPAAHSGNRHRVTLRPGGTAHALLGIVDAGVLTGCHRVAGTGLEVFPPGQTVRQPIRSFSFSACSNKRFMGVLPVQSLVGIP
jgi:hypothetical protein